MAQEIPNLRSPFASRASEKDIPIRKTVLDRIGQFLVERMLGSECSLESEHRHPVFNDLGDRDATAAMQGQVKV